ncbi:MAG: hypothetical protein LBT44_09500 [Clostridiales bacterium]|jgi:hypothetical protein|nr:hypothetical protein [Clostridiales bacterium]
MKHFHFVIVAVLSVISAVSLIAAYLVWTNTQLTRRTQENTIALLNIRIEDLTARADALSEKNEDLQKHVQILPHGDGIYHSFTLDDTSDDILIFADSRFPPELVEMLSRHFTAMYAGDTDGFQSTISPPDNDWVLGFLKKQNEPFQLKAILMWAPADQIAFGENFGAYLQAMLLYDDNPWIPDLRSVSYTVGVTNHSGDRSGDWLVYDYD